MTKPTTMKQIAERAQVSIGTVSHVVNGTAPVREKLRKRVLDVITSLGYQPSQLARGLRRDSTNMLGMVIPDITNPFFPGVVRGVEDVAFNKSYRVVLCNTDNDPAKEKAYIDELRSYRPAGLLIIAASERGLSSELGYSIPQGIPLIFLDRRPSDWKGDAVMVANEEGAFQATQYLLKMGHTRLAMLSGPSHDERCRASRGISQSPGKTQGDHYTRIRAGNPLRPRQRLPKRPASAQHAASPHGNFRGKRYGRTGCVARSPGIGITLPQGRLHHWL